MEFEKNTTLFGADATPRIVAIELGETGTIRVYRRERDGSTSADVEPFHPFLWCSSDVADLGIETEELSGSLKYGWLISVDSWKELIALRNGFKMAGRDFFAFTDPVQHYLTATGRTLFKDLPFEELKRLQLEVLSSEGDDNHIMSIALSDNTGWEELIIVDPKDVEESEHVVMKRLTALIKERDPDVIEGHDLFRVHLPLLAARAKKLKTKLDWGRSDGFLRSRPSRLQIAEKTIDYPKFTVGGRHFVDTFLLAQFYDVGMVHSQRREAPVKLIRIEGQNLDHMRRSKIKAAQRVRDPAGVGGSAGARRAQRLALKSGEHGVVVAQGGGRQAGCAGYPRVVICRLLE